MKLNLSLVGLMFISLNVMAEKSSNETIIRNPASILENQKQIELKQKDLEKMRELKKDIQKILLTNKI